MAPPPLIPLSTTDAETTSKLKNAINDEESNFSGDEDDEAEAEADDGELAEQMNAQVRRKYIKGKKLGEGTYAIVYKGHLRTNPSVIVAIKKIKILPELKEDGITPDAINEIKALQELSHPNIIKLLAIFSTKNQNLNLVIEFLPGGDLEMIIKRRPMIAYYQPQMKAWMGMLCRALFFCHEHSILHRDIKPSNLLIAANGELKLADFGLARSIADPYVPMTTKTITICYRPLELLFDAPFYSAAVDVWSVGCVMAELTLRNIFLPGEKELEQVAYISERIGTPTEQNWPGVSSLPSYLAPDPSNVTPLRTKAGFMVDFAALGSKGVDLLMAMLTLDPKKRITMRQALNHGWWSSEPKPAQIRDLPKVAGGEQVVAQDFARPALEKSKLDGVARKLF